MKLIVIFLASLSLGFTNPTPEIEAEKKPLFEAGLGGGGGYLPDYPGSDQSRLRGVPFPYFIYRGEIIKSDQRKGTRARFFSGERFEFDLSGAGSFPASSEDNDARQGMPDLDWIGEVGPRVVFELPDPFAMWRLTLKVPARLVFSSDLKIGEHRGYSFTPEFAFERFGLLHEKSRLAVEISFNFMDDELSDYFYKVDPEFATSERSAYDAHAGYMGTEISVSFTHPIGSRLRTSTRISYDYYGGSANQGSPLHKADSSVALSAGLIWVFWESESKVDHD